MGEQIDVLLDVNALDVHLGGIGRYTWELARRLPSQPQISSLRYFARNRVITDPGRLVRGEPIYRGRGFVRARRAWAARRALRTSLVHGPNYFLPAGVERGVITVHDLSVFKYPESHPRERLEHFDRLFSKSVESAAHILTDTETVRLELMDQFGVAGENITSVPLGVDEAFKPAHADILSPLLHKFGLRAGEYGLCVSAFEPRKRVPELIRAWGELPPALRSAYPLVLAGGPGWLNQHIHDSLDGPVSQGWVRYLGYVSERDLPQLYAGAALFVYPSVYEGFGLPPVEAMASGVPVIVANRSCLPEVCGDAAQYVDPDDLVQFSAAIQESLENPQQRAEFVRRGLKRAAGYTWERCISATAAVYHTASRR